MKQKKLIPKILIILSLITMVLSAFFRINLITNIFILTGSLMVGLFSIWILTSK